MNRNHSILLWTPVLAAGVVFGATGNAAAGVPSAATRVAVTAGVTHFGIDAHLTPAASISGKITSVAGGKPVYTHVVAYRAGHVAGGAYTDRYGRYTIGGLAASSTGYAVCAVGYNRETWAFGGGSHTGYLGRCYRTVSWNSRSAPSGATLIPLAKSQQKYGINIALRSAAAISGTVRSPNGTPLNTVGVFGRNRSTGAIFFAGTSSKGYYRLIGLTPSSKGYTVCFNPRSSPQGVTGFLPRCYKKVAWGAGSTYPSTAVAVFVASGKTHSGISVRLPRAGAISGTVRDPKTGTPLASAAVRVFSAKGRQLGDFWTKANGQYVVKGLAAASADRVCVLPQSSYSPTLGYKGQCWHRVAWNGGALPSGLSGVRVTLGKTHTGISFRPARVKLGSISGRVTDAVGHHPVHNASVVAYGPNGNGIGGTLTASNGTYKVTGLPVSSTGYSICVNAEGATSSTPTTTGWASTCYHAVPWVIPIPPSGTTKVAVVSANMNRVGVDVVLPEGGAIAGTVYQGPGIATPIRSGLEVVLYTAQGRYVGGTYSSTADGTYYIGDLSTTSKYVVCFYGEVFGARGYYGQCYNRVPWTAS